MLDIKLKTFLEVANTMNFTKASKNLHITQPAVSNHIHLLEKDYQCKLFNYHHKKLSLTKEGQFLQKRVRTLVNDELILKEQLRTGLPTTEHLKIGLTKTIGGFIAMKPLSHYLKEHHYENATISIKNTSALLSELRDGTINLALIEGHFDNQEFDSLVYSMEKFVCVAHKDHQFSQPVKKLEDLLDETIILREDGSGTRALLVNELFKNNLRLEDFKKTIVINAMHPLIQLVEDDLGISFMYQSAITDELRSGDLQVIPLENFEMIHNFTFVWLASSIFSEHYHTIAQEISTI